MVLASRMVPLSTMRTALDKGTRLLRITSSGFRVGRAGAKAGGQKHRHGFGDEAGAGVEVEDAAPAGGGVSGFLEEFALGRRESFFAGIDAPGGEFPQIVVGGMAVLALQQDAGRGAGFIDGQDHHRAAVMNDIAAGADAAGFLHVVGGDPEDRAAIDGAGRNQLCFGIRSLAGLGWL